MKKTLLFLLFIIALNNVKSQSIVVTYIAGQDNCNAPPEGGTYAVVGTLNGKNQYSSNSSHFIEWNGTQWIFRSYTSISGWTTIYTNPSTASTPPCTGWVATFGCFIPTFSGGCGAPPLVASTSQVNLTCNGVPVGSASVFPSGGTSPYTYAWSPTGGSAATASGLSAGNYTCTITDASATSITKVFALTQPSAITATASQTNIVCNGGATGKASVTVSGGTGAYTYAWSPSGGTAATATGLSVGIYTCTITDANSCTKTQVFTLTQPTALTATTSQTNIVCNGGATGKASVTVSGGTGAYTYAWSPSGGTAATATGLSATNYTCTITDANSCTITKVFTLTQPTVLTAITSQTNIVCNGGTTGKASVTVSGGTSAYTYAWSPSGGTAATGTGLIATNYTCTITDANSCTITKAFALTQPTAITPTASQTNIACNGGTTGKASVTVSGGTGAYTYAWSPSGGTAAMAIGLSAANYTCTITDANSCIKTQAFALTQPTTLLVSATANNATVCAGSSTTLTANGSGGTGAITYTWVAGPTNNISVVTLTATTVYTVNATDVNSCSNSATVSVVANVCAVAEALNFDGVNDRVNLGSGITTSLTGSTKVSVEAWVKPTSLTGLGCILGNYSSGSAALQILLRRSGNSFYEFWVGNGGTWYNTNSVATPTLNVWQHVSATWDGTVASIYVNGVLSGTTTPAISTLGNASNNPVWIGSNTLNENFTGNIDEVRIWNIVRTQCEINTYKNCEIPATATGLIANYHFNQGVDGGTNTSVTTLTDATASAFTGTLTNMALTGTTSNWVAPGGVVSGSITPAVLTPAVGSTVTNSVICLGNSTTLSGIGANIYSWTNGVTNAAAFSPTVTATYTVTGTNTLTGCSNTAVNTVTVNALPTITVSSGAVCAGQSYTINANGASTYTSVPSLAGPVVTPTATTSYSITGTDANGCVSSNTVVSTVTVNNLPTISVNSGTICAGNSFTMTPSGASTYTYSNGSAVATPTANASYNVTGTDANGCISSSAAVSSVTVNVLPTISVNSGAICTGNSFTMTPSGASTYTYSNGSAVATPTANASYNVTGTDANGCISSSAAVSSVTVNALPMVMATTNSTLLCSGQTASLTASGATSYTWNTSATTAVIAVSPTTTVTYTVTYTVNGTDANGCSNVATVTQNVNACTDIQSTVSNQPSLISVYPNPTGGIVNVELESLNDKNVNIQILNTLGEVLMNESINTQHSAFNIQHFATGVYFVKVIENNKQQVIKLIKQ